MGGGEYQFALGDPWVEPITDMSWKEYLARFYRGSFEDYFESDNPNDWPNQTEEVNPHTVMETWVW